MKKAIVNNKFKIIITLVIVLTLIISASFAWLNFQLNSSNSNVLKAGYLSLYLDETTTEGISLEYAIPTADTKGLSQEGYTFQLVNDGTVASNYTIYLDDLELEENETRMPDSVVKYSLTKNGIQGETTLLTAIGENPERVVDLGTIEPNTTNTYTLKLWMSSDATNEVMGTVFYGKLRVETEQQNINVDKSDMIINLAETDRVIDLGGEDISNYTIISRDLSVATIDSTTGIITPNNYGQVIFSARNKITGAKKEITVTIQKTLTVTYITQTGATSIDKEINTDTCALSENTAISCSITLPNITASSGYSVVGWNSDKTAHTGDMGTIIVSEDTTLYTIMKKDEIKYKATFVNQGVGIESIGNDELTCTIDAVYNDEEQATSCKVTLPTINVEEGYTVIGWSDVENATTGVVPGTEVELTKATTDYYAIIKKDAVTLSAKFYRNGTTSLDGNTGDELIKTCVLEEVYNDGEQATECTITAPSIEANTATPTVIGYNESKDAIVSTLAAGEELVLTKDVEYYAITKAEMKELTATFYRNGAKSLDGDTTSDYIVKQCNIAATYNGVAQDESCNVTSPVIVGTDETPTVLGYSKASDDHTSIWASKEEKPISVSANYYAQTTKEAKELNVEYKIGANVSAIGKEGDSCTIDAVYNGETQNTSCSLEAPSIIPNTGYTSVGWSTTNGDTAGSTSITLTETTNTYYANATANSYTVEYYKEGTKLGSSGVKVDETLILTSIETLNGVKEGYTFKGWSTDETSQTVIYKDEHEVSNLTTTEGEIVKLYAVYVDNISPVCTWSTPGTITTQNTTTLTLTCTDTGSGLPSQTLSTSNFSVLSSTYGSVTAVSSPIAVTNGYSYTVTVKGLSSGSTQTTNGSFTVSLNANSIKDNDNNYNIDTTSSAVTVAGRSYTATFTKQGTGVTAIGSNSLGCTSIGTSTTCSITLPTITVSSGYTAVGWNTSSSATTGTVAGTSVTLSDENTDENNKINYYSISYKNAVTLSATWNANGATLTNKSTGAAITSGTKSTCTLAAVYNNATQSTSCTVTAPTITRSGYTIVGFNTSASSTTSALASGGTLTLTSSNTGKTWYALTAKAQIGSNYYVSLATAATAATANQTINLLQNTSESVTFTKSITLDMKAKQVTGVLQPSGSGITLTITGSGTIAGRVLANDGTKVTIKNGTITNNNASNTITVFSGGNLIVEGGTIEYRGTGEKTCAIKFYNDTGSTKATGTIKGGKILSTNTSFAAVQVYYSTLTITGGEIESEGARAAVQNYCGTTTINGSSVTLTSNSTEKTKATFRNYCSVEGGAEYSFKAGKVINSAGGYAFANNSPAESYTGTCTNGFSSSKCG